MIVPNPLRRPPKQQRSRDVRLYFTKRWARFRRRYLEQYPFCVHCQQHGIYTPAVDVDHIIELRDGGLEYDESNLQGLCKRHHRIKTLKYSRRGRGVS